MAGEYLVDTNILIAYLKFEPGVVARLHTVPTPVWIPFITMGELYYGAQQSTRRETNLANVDALAARFNVIFPDAATLRKYGEVRAFLKRAGRPIPEADIWISAIALQHEAILVSRDEHFDAVKDLRLERW